MPKFTQLEAEHQGKEKAIEDESLMWIGDGELNLERNAELEEREKLEGPKVETGNAYYHPCEEWLHLLKTSKPAILLQYLAAKCGWIKV